MRLLVAENDPALATFLHESLSHEHYAVDLTGDGEDAKHWVEERDYDLVILDLNLVRVEATQVLQYVRTKRRHVPILVLCSRNRAEERVQILDMGADDLVLKPFAFSELSARVRALLRRGGRSAEAVLCIEDLELNRVEHSVKRAGRAIELTPKEFGLLEYLMRNAGQRVTRAQIIEHVWNLSFDTMTNVVDVYINYLRKKIDGAPERKLIHTVRGVGYEMHASASADSRADARELVRQS
jgi:DNA-binding response OmpR family regulator